VEIKAELLAFDLGQRQADFDLAENAASSFGVTLSLCSRRGHDRQCVCYDFLSSGHTLTSLFVLVMFYF
jgi:hypothetical protein